MRNNRLKIFWISLIVFGLLFSTCPAKEVKDIPLSDGVEDLLGEFEEKTNDPVDTNLESFDKLRENFWIDLKGYLEMGATYNYAHDAPLSHANDWRGLSSLYTKIFSQAKMDLSQGTKAVVSGIGFYDAAFMIDGKDGYSNNVIKTYESDLEIWEAYIQGTLSDNLDYKVGRQIVVWGTSDIIRVVDVLNPLDLRKPGMTDIEDLRLPLIVSRLDYYMADFSVTAMAIHEHRFDKNPVFGSDFYPLNSPLPPEEDVGSEYKNTEWALSIKGVFDKWDVLFCFARIFNDRAHMELEPFLDRFVPVMAHAKVNMLGAAAQFAWGNWLFKAESAWIDGIKFFNRPDQSFSRWDVLAGLEYFGFKETLITFELANRHIINFESELQYFPDYGLEDDVQAILRISKDFLHETLNFTFLGSVFGTHAQNGSFQRYSLEYHFTDAWSILTGMVNYQAGNKMEMKKIGKNDRVFIQLTHNF